MRAWVLLIWVVGFSFAAPAQTDEVFFEEAFALCSLAETETEKSQCFPLAWSALKSAHFVILALKEETPVDGEELAYHSKVRVMPPLDAVP